MKKIYSFVLMAAMLLIGTNAWAAFEFGGNSYSTLQSAINAAPAGQTTEIEMTSDYEGNATAYLATENATDPAKHIILDLNNKSYEYTGTAKIAIAVAHGTLEIKSTGSTGDDYGTISSSTTTIEDMIRVYGTYEEVNAKVNAPFAHLIIREHVEVKNLHMNAICVDVMRPDQPKLFGMDSADPSTMIKYSCDVFKSKSSGFGVANGARVDVYGKVTSEGKYGIKVNGCVRVGSDYVQADINSSLRNNYEPKYNGGTNTGTYDIASAADEFSPYVFIASTGYVSTSATASKAVAAYSSGFGRWRIEGYCGGSTGLYVKSGQIEIADGHIQSTNTSATQPVGQGSGVTAGGSAIVVESNDKYSGNISVVISGNSEITATAGYAIEETITKADPNATTEVESISIQGGSIQGGSQGAIIVEDKTKSEVSVVGGSVEGTVKVDGTGTVSLETLIPGSTTDGTDPAKDDNDFRVEVEDKDGDGHNEIVIKPNPSKVVTMNAYGLATFSAEVARKIPASATVKAYTAIFNSFEQVLELHEITTREIPADKGVILFGKADSTYVFNATESATALGTNHLVAANLWPGTVQDNVYVLSGDQMFKYEGADMKPNKAYLKIGLTSAPQRIRMVVAQAEEEQQTEAIINVEPATVKAVKFMENGEIFIRRGENVYNLQGQIVK